VDGTDKIPARRFRQRSVIVIDLAERLGAGFTADDKLAVFIIPAMARRELIEHLKVRRRQGREAPLAGPGHLPEGYRLPHPHRL